MWRPGKCGAQRLGTRARRGTCRSHQVHSSHGPGHSGSCSHQLQEIDVRGVSPRSAFSCLRCGARERMQGPSDWVDSALGQGRTETHPIPKGCPGCRQPRGSERLQCHLWPAEVNVQARDSRTGPRPEPRGALTSGRLYGCPQDAQQAHEM